MDYAKAFSLATQLAVKAEAERLLRRYCVSQSANDENVWCVTEHDKMRHNTPILQVWISPEMSFPL